MDRPNFRLYPLAMPEIRSHFVLERTEWGGGEGGSQIESLNRSEFRNILNRNYQEVCNKGHYKSFDDFVRFSTRENAINL